MKSLEELKAIREQMKDKVAIRTGSGDIRIVVGMATWYFRRCTSGSQHIC